MIQGSVTILAYFVVDWHLLHTLYSLFTQFNGGINFRIQRTVLAFGDIMQDLLCFLDQ